MSRSAPLLAFYGDDFTGSTDALESLSRAGAKTMLFLDPPSAEQLSRIPELDAIGVAGLTRSMAPEEMATTLRPAFASLRDLNVSIVHYKVCSTFDSSPSIGNIGRAAEIGREVFRAPFVPIVAGAPELGRFCVFGNLFARFGTAGAGAIHRLDRHPSMSRHPVTPADEADLQKHLAKQTSLKIDLLDILATGGPLESARASLADVLEGSPNIVFFDLLDPSQYPTVGALIAEQAKPGETLFMIGSSGVGAALGKYWQNSGVLRPRHDWPTLSPAQPLLVLSGSASPVTAAQIQHAISAGFVEIRLDTDALLRSSDSAIQEAQSAILKALDCHQSVVAHTCRGPDDPRLHTATSQNVDTALLLGTALGRLGLAAAQAKRIHRIVFAGGDSSSYAARALSLEAVEMLAPLAPGAPLCRAYSADPAIDGLEVNFKGGQVGAVDYFVTAAGQ